jgi:ABC-type dipeptide/oligopeptide/nickel transport system ATPase component
MEQLNHHNPEYVTWKYEELNFTLLGGIRIEGLHSMRVTLKIDCKTYPSIRQSADLYNEGQTEKLVKKVAERFTLSTTYIHKAIGHLINTVEDYRLQQLDNKNSRQLNNKQILRPEEQQQAIEFLQQNNLLKTTGEAIGWSGVIGEEANRLIMYLVFTSRKTARPLHIISFGSSGAGKSHLQEKVAELIPEEDKIEITSVSGNAFYYYDKDELGHKLILIEDYDGVLSALYPIRELQSKQKIQKTITVRDKSGNTKTLHLTVHGPVSIGGCTTNEHIYEDNANRSFLIYVDESQAQDEKVMSYQRKLSAGKIDITEQKKIQKLLQNVQRILHPVTVRNPYAEQLIIPREVFKPRRTNAHYIAFIEAISFYKQYQRRWISAATGAILYDPASSDSLPIAGEAEGAFIETTLEDITEANELMKAILLKKSDELGYASRNYLERLKAYLQQRDADPSPFGGSRKGAFTNSEIRKKFREHPSKQKRIMIELQQYGYIKKTEGDKKKGFVYTVVSEQEYTRLQQSINTALDEVLKKLGCPPPLGELEGASLQEVHTSIEPLKSPTAKKRRQVVQ